MARAARSAAFPVPLGGGNSAQGPPEVEDRTRTCGVLLTFAVIATKRVPSAARTSFRCVLYAVARGDGGSDPAETGGGSVASRIPTARATEAGTKRDVARRTVNRRGWRTIRIRPPARRLREHPEAGTPL